MKGPLLSFLAEVRRAGVPVSTAESIDALRAATHFEPEREVLREALATAVVKDEADRATFDEVFDRFFSAGGEEPGKRRRRRAAGGVAAAAGRSRGEGEGGGRPQPPERETKPRPPTQPARERPSLRPGTRERPRESESLARRRRRRALLRRPFREMDPAEAEELPALAAELARRFRARLRRRLRRGRRGRLDFRRTLRGSVPRGGAAVDLFFRRRRPGKIDLVALCDVSGSVRYATDFFAAVLAPSADWFRRVRLFCFVDRLVEAEIEGGRLVPAGIVDFHAFSDLGRVLVEFEETAIPLGRNTVLLVLGDARNNRRPPRADVLARLRARARAVWWLDPERRELWDTGDSVIGAYRPHCDALLECADGASLLRALARLAAAR